MIYYKNTNIGIYVKAVNDSKELNVNLDDINSQEAAEQETVIFIDMYFGSSFLCSNVFY